MQSSRLKRGLGEWQPKARSCFWRRGERNLASMIDCSHSRSGSASRRPDRTPSNQPKVNRSWSGGARLPGELCGNLHPHRRLAHPALGRRICTAVRERRFWLSLTADSGTVCLNNFQVGKALAHKKIPPISKRSVVENLSEFPMSPYLNCGLSGSVLAFLLQSLGLPLSQAVQPSVVSSFAVDFR